MENCFEKVCRPECSKPTGPNFSGRQRRRAAPGQHTLAVSLATCLLFLDLGQRPALPACARSRSDSSKNCQLLARILRHSTSSTVSALTLGKGSVGGLCFSLVPQPSCRQIQRQQVPYVQLTFPLGQDGGKELTEQPKAFGKTGRPTAGSPSVHSSSTARRRSGEG